ncbi:AAA family ATPase [Pseudonocardia adelaidensis]|uniref:AAA+ ATPase domain-containing protein n=1 Tax=Pseudonocardia adelaidensis TaxID=648754 RepID=A0ABP9NIP3_9PSEU
MTTAEPCPTDPRTDSTGTGGSPTDAGAGAVTASGRLRAGELRRRVAQFLADHPTDPVTPGEIARNLARSPGAVANALGVLASRGEAEQLPTRPVRYRATPTTAAATAIASRRPTTGTTTVGAGGAKRPRRCTGAGSGTTTCAAGTATATAAGTVATAAGTTPGGGSTTAAAATTAATTTAATTAPATAAAVSEESVTGPVARPNGTSYHPRRLSGMADVTALRNLRRAGVPALMYGPPGTGKTSVVEAAFGDLITVQGDGDTTVADFVGEYTQTADGRYQFVHGPLVRAMREGRALFIDDATLIPPTVLAVVYPAMDGRREIILKAHAGEVVTAVDGFYVVAGHNPGVHGAVLTDALASRFSVQIRVSTDYDLAAQLAVDRRAVKIARNLATRVEKGEIGWAPQLRELLAFQKIAEVLGPMAAAANLVGIAPEDDQETVAAVVRTVFGTPVEPLALGTRI